MGIKTLENELQGVPALQGKHLKAAPFGYYLYCEFLKIFRDPWAVVFGVALPTVFFLIFGTSLYAKYASALLAQYAAYATFVAAFQIFSISIASERARGWNRLLRTTPVSAMLYLGTRFLVVVSTGVLSLLLLFAVAALVGHVQIPIATWLSLFGFMLLGMIPFALAGIFLGFAGSPNLSQALATILTLLLSFASGLYVPLAFMPAIVGKIAPFMPTYHLAQIAWFAVGSQWGRDSSPLWVHLAVSGGFALLFGILAVWAYLRDWRANFA